MAGKLFSSVKTDFSKWPTEKISRLVLFGMILLTAIIFVAFFLIGYNRPYLENPNYNAPLLTGTLIAYLCVALTAALLLVIVSVAKKIRLKKGSPSTENGVPATKITLATAGLTVLTLVVTFLLGSGTDNGVEASSFWNKAADMFVNSSLFLIFVAILAIVSSYIIGKKQKRR